MAVRRSVGLCVVLLCAGALVLSEAACCKKWVLDNPVGSEKGCEGEASKNDGPSGAGYGFGHGYGLMLWYPHDCTKRISTWDFRAGQLVKDCGTCKGDPRYTCPGCAFLNGKAKCDPTIPNPTPSQKVLNCDKTCFAQNTVPAPGAMTLTVDGGKIVIAGKASRWNSDKKGDEWKKTWTVTCNFPGFDGVCLPPTGFTGVKTQAGSFGAVPTAVTCTMTGNGGKLELGPQAPATLSKNAKGELVFSWKFCHRFVAPSKCDGVAKWKLTSAGKNMVCHKYFCEAHHMLVAKLINPSMCA